MLDRDTELTLRLCNTLQTSAINARHHFYLCARIDFPVFPLAFARPIKPGFYVRGVQNFHFLKLRAIVAGNEKVCVCQ